MVVSIVIIFKRVSRIGHTIWVARHSSDFQPSYHHVKRRHHKPGPSRPLHKLPWPTAHRIPPGETGVQEYRLGQPRLPPIPSKEQRAKDRGPGQENAA